MKRVKYYIRGIMYTLDILYMYIYRVLSAHVYYLLFNFFLRYAFQTGFDIVCTPIRTRTNNDSTYAI